MKGQKMSISGMSREQKDRCYAAYGMKCYYCGEVLGGKDITIDHIIPVKHGGTHLLDNTVPCCRRCNVDKKDLYLDEWLAIMKIRRNKLLNKAKKLTRIVKSIEDRQNYLKLLGKNND